MTKKFDNLSFSQIVQRVSAIQHPLGIADAFGDSLLLRDNATYRNVRCSVRKLGFRFSSKRFLEHSLNPMSALVEILEARIIPFAPNRKPMEIISKKISPEFGWFQVVLPIGNYHFHESCHGIAHSVLKTDFRKLAEPPIKEQQRFLLELLLSEAFANAVEIFSNFDSKSELVKYMLLLNSYLVLPQRHATYCFDQIRSLKLPKPTLLRALLFGFLFVNYGYFVPGRRDFDRAWPLIHPYGKKLSAAQKDALFEFFSGAKVLSPTFVLKTNPHFVSLLGIRTPYAKLLDFDFIGEIEENPRYRKAIDQMITAVLKPDLFARIVSK